jgi:hypothetical protein
MPYISRNLWLKFSATFGSFYEHNHKTHFKVCYKQLLSNRLNDVKLTVIYNVAKYEIQHEAKDYAQQII